ncbi:MAG: nucleotidyltransferase domain-containing protein [Candidatus Eisenbacteria bacterium]|nr:nucleotidyltransferase domain-containing protein [Candidatus Eisenbacteria bacterium]
MPRLRNIDIENGEKVFEKLDVFTRKLRKKFSIRAVYLYGSLAKGEMHEGSDIDLMIVGDFKGRIFQRITEVLKLTDLPIEPLVYTNEEFRRMKKTNSFVKEALRTAQEL